MSGVVQAKRSYDRGMDLSLPDAALADYLEAQLPAFRGPLRSSKFKGGQSNPTYLIEADSGRYVLRRKPPGALLASAHAVRTSAHVADLMHRMGGTSGIYERSRLERHFRDAQTVRHHGFLCEARLETVGQVYLGLDPEFAFAAF